LSIIINKVFFGHWYRHQASNLKSPSGSGSVAISFLTEQYIDCIFYFNKMVPHSDEIWYIHPKNAQK